MMRDGRLSSEVATDSERGEQGIVELGTIVGYYTAIGNALNAFQVPLPAGAPQPFPE
jgi:hypothetical protein